MADPSIVICSFYTDDEYYRSAAKALASDLDALGERHVIELLPTEPGEQWPDICRRKIGFIARVCADFPGARVFWMDVDCTLQSLPEFVRNFTADVIGFQRGFDSPLAIGYQSRSRFWEPSFIGINATAGGRALIAEAARLERTLTIRATDDYFLEEGWRATAQDLSFQVIPSRLSSRSGVGDPGEFFTFGASGNVAEYKGQVQQHSAVGRQRSTARAVVRSARRMAKSAEARLPTTVSRRLRVISDRTGVTRRLVATPIASTPQREALVVRALRASQLGDEAKFDSAAAALTTTARLTAAEEGALQAGRAFLHYARDGIADAPAVPLAWWAQPYPGNFGDWLSPLVVSAHTDRRIRYQQPTAAASERHLVAIGSIGRFIKPNSVVVGTGIASEDTDMARRAQYVSVRGPLTAATLKAQGGPAVDSFGDPGLLLSRIVPVSDAPTNGRLAVVRHTNHRSAPLRLPDDADELSVLMSHPADIHDFLVSLAGYDGVITSAMHVMIACHSYGIPVALVTFEGFVESVPGSGMKYVDYARGAELEEVPRPVTVSPDLRGQPLRSMLVRQKVSDSKLDEIALALGAALGHFAPADSR